jgi:hypothetical protein
VPDRRVPPRSPQRLNGHAPELDLELALMLDAEPELDPDPDVHELPEPGMILAGMALVLATGTLTVLGVWKLGELVARALQ